MLPSRAPAKTHSDVVVAIMSLVGAHAHVRISDPCALAGHGQCPLLCRDLRAACIELGRCISPEIASTRTDLIPASEEHGEHEIDKTRNPQNWTSVRATGGRMRLKTPCASATDTMDSPRV